MHLSLVIFVTLVGLCLSAPAQDVEGQQEKRGHVHINLGHLYGSKMCSIVKTLSYAQAKLESRFKALEQRMRSVKEHCIPKHTNWQPNAEKNIVYLDRHPMFCPSMYYMRGFKMTRNGPHNIRYEYICCRVHVQH